MLNRMGSCLLVAFAAIAVLYSCASAQTEKKTLYAVLVDNTKSMERQFTQGRVLGKGVIKRIHDRGSISVFSFEAQPRPSRQTLARSIGWTNNEVALTSYIDGLSPVGGYAALLESIEKMADELGAAAKTNGGVVGAKVLILITDGVVRFYGKEGPNANRSSSNFTATATTISSSRPANLLRFRISTSLRERSATAITARAPTALP